MKAIILLIIIFISMHVKADILWLTNGDIISGTLLYSDSETASFDSIAAGHITIPLNQIQTLETEALIRIKLGDVALPMESKFRKSKDGMVKLDDGNLIELKDIYHLARLKPFTLDWNWDGNLEASFDIKRNVDEDTQDFKTHLDTRVFNVTWRHSLNAEYNYVTEFEIKKTHNYTAEYSVDYFFGRPLFWRVRSRYERDYFNSNKRNLDVATGLGYQFWDNEQGRLHVTGEVVRSRYRYDIELSSTLIFPFETEFNSIGFSWDYKQVFLVPNVELFSFGDLHHPHTIDINYILHSESGIRYYLRHHITLSLRYEYDHLNQTQFSQKSQRYLMGVGVKW